MTGKVKSGNFEEQDINYGWRLRKRIKNLALLELREKKRFEVDI